MANRTTANAMPKSAAKTTARKAYATALASQKKKTFNQRMEERAGSWGSPKIAKAKKGTTGSLKQMGQRAKVK